jgi:hypothetical protein
MTMSVTIVTFALNSFRIQGYLADISTKWQLTINCFANMPENQTNIRTTFEVLDKFDDLMTVCHFKV